MQQIPIDPTKMLENLSSFMYQKSWCIQQNVQRTEHWKFPFDEQKSL